MPDGRGLWTLIGFNERFDAWVAREDPSADLRFVVYQWIFSRMEDPYEGARREPGKPNLWWVQVRGATTGRPGDIKVVLCSFWIYEVERMVECDTFSIVSYPL